MKRKKKKPKKKGRGGSFPTIDPGRPSQRQARLRAATHLVERVEPEPVEFPDKRRLAAAVRALEADHNHGSCLCVVNLCFPARFGTGRLENFLCENLAE
jgi:hypothetical protein